MNQLAKLDFWSESAYVSTTPVVKNTTNTADYITKSSGGLFAANASATITKVEAASPTATSGGETTYLKTNHKSSYVLHGISCTQAALDLIDAQAGFEIHFNELQTNAGGLVSTFSGASYGIAFTVGGKAFSVGWSSNNGLYAWSSASGKTTSFGGNGTNLFTATHADISVNGQEAGNNSTVWSTQKVKAFLVLSGSDYILYVKVSEQTSSNIIAYFAANLGAITPEWTAINKAPHPTCRTDNLSLYYITSAQATTYAADIDGTPTNDMLPFQRYLPMLDIARVGGTGWTDTDDVEDPDLAYGDLVDGSLTTFATTATTNPIGIDGTASLGTLLANGYYWTPGTLTALPTIGIIRSLQNSKYQLASTEAETVRTKFGDGTDSITFDTTSGAVESGETIVNTVFSDNGTFTDGVDSVVIDTATTLRSTIELTA